MFKQILAVVAQESTVALGEDLDELPAILTENVQADAFGNKVPELPNFITLLHHYFEEAPWVQLLHAWENVVFAAIAACVISLALYLGARQRALVPGGWQNFVEFTGEKLLALIASVLGGEAKKYLPFLGTLFIYVLTMNLMGLVPFMKAPSSNLNTTVALALCVFALVQYLNIKNMGVKGFIYHLAGSPQNTLGWLLAPFMICLEILSQLARPVTLALRLFGNVLGEDILIGAFALFGLLLVKDTYLPIGIPLQLPFVFLALLLSSMQALVFTLLSAVYIQLSMPEEHH
jgi:F-type H+-transporting ATPase subunit a